MKLTRRSVNLGLTASLVTPVFSRVARAAGETIKIGMVTHSRRRQGNGRYLRNPAIATFRRKRRIAQSRTFLATRSGLLRQAVGQLFQPPTAGEPRC